MNRLPQNLPNAVRRGLTQVAARAHQAYRHLPSAKSIVGTMCCQGPQATSVMEQQNIPHNSTRGGTSLDRPTAVIPETTTQLQIMGTNRVDLVQESPAAEEPTSDDATSAATTIQNQNDSLRTPFDDWVNESPNEREVREQVKDKIQIFYFFFGHMKLVVNGDLDLRSTTISSLPQGLTVGGNLDIRWCTGLTKLPQGLTVGGHLGLFGCTSLRELPDWVFNIFDLLSVPDHLKQTDTYKIFQILKHFDTHNTIADINNQELIRLYNQDQINTLIHNRHCFRIAYSLCKNKTLTPQQVTFKDNANEQTKNQIRDHICHMLTPNQLLTINDIDSHLELFKEHLESTVCAHDIPELQRLSLLSLKKDCDADSLGNVLTYPQVSTQPHYKTFLDTQLDLLEFSHSKLKLWERDIHNN